MKKGLPWELVLELAEHPLMMLIGTCRCGAIAGGTCPEGLGTLSFGDMGVLGGDQEANIRSHGGAGVVEPSTVGILSDDCLVFFSMSSHLPKWRTGS